MSRLTYAALWITTWAVALAACGDDDSTEPDDAPASSQRDGAPADASESCGLPRDCPDVRFLDMSMKACCASSEPCGYELPPLDDEIKMDFPQAQDLYDELTSADPDGRCAPLSFFFGDAPTLPEARVEVEDGEDILLTPDCTSFHVLAWSLPGCCLPDDRCGLSTDASWTIFANIIQGDGVPFDHPQCLSAEALNQQFRDSVVLESFARTTASGTCDHAALDERLTPPPDSDSTP
jgi:hypothetical protein